MVYIPYTSIVLLTFVPYAIPNWEIKSLITVIVFGPLTMLQGFVILGGCVMAVTTKGITMDQIFFFAYGTFITLFFERFLQHKKWAKQDAQKAMS